LARNRLIARQIIITGELVEHLKDTFIFVIVDFFVKVMVLWLKQAYSQQAKSGGCFASSKPLDMFSATAWHSHSQFLQGCALAKSLR
jgi:hypothetical protein